MGEQTGVAAEILTPLRAICSALPEVIEEEAWVGTRWVVRKQTFAHVLVIDHAWPPAYVRAFETDGPLTVLTFQAPLDEVEAYRAIGRPFFLPPWRPGIVGLALDGEDGPLGWSEVEELVTESYCTLAPQRLIARLPRPASPDR